MEPQSYFYRNLSTSELTCKTFFIVCSTDTLVPKVFKNCNRFLSYKKRYRRCIKYTTNHKIVVYTLRVALTQVILVEPCDQLFQVTRFCKQNRDFWTEILHLCFNVLDINLSKDVVFKQWQNPITSILKVVIWSVDKCFFCYVLFLKFHKWICNRTKSTIG